jgi:hypothetical protein
MSPRPFVVIPHIPLPFEEVMKDVLKVKPPERPSKKKPSEKKPQKNYSRHRAKIVVSETEYLLVWTLHGSSALRAWQMYTSSASGKAQFTAHHLCALEEALHSCQHTTAEFAGMRTGGCLHLDVRVKMVAMLA